MGILRLDWNVVATIVNIIVLYWLMKKFLYKPLQMIMDKRKELIDSQFSEAKEAKDKADALKNEYESLIGSAKDESQQIVDKARETAKADYDDKLEDASNQASRLLEEAREKIDMEREKMLRELESQIASLAMCAAAKVIGKKASAQYDEALYEQFLSEAGEENDADRE